jgi:hypothetical protein
MTTQEVVAKSVYDILTVSPQPLPLLRIVSKHVGLETPFEKLAPAEKELLYQHKEEIRAAIKLMIDKKMIKAVARDSPKEICYMIAIKKISGWENV